MSWLSTGLKKLESNVGSLYDKNLRSLVEEYKRPVLGMAAGAGLSLIPGVGLPMAMMAGGGLGYARTEQRKKEEKEARAMEAAQRAREQAEGELREINDPYLQIPDRPGEQPPPSFHPELPGDPTAPPGETPPYTPGPVSPVDPGIGGIRPGDTGSALDEKKLIQEAELQRQLQLEQWEQANALRAQYQQELAQTLQSQMDRQFQESLPGMYEDLNTRGLLRSSALGDRMSTEQSKLAARTNEQLALQAIQDQYGSLGQLGGIHDQYGQARYGAIDRRFSMEDYARQIEASLKMGQAMTPMQQYSGGNSKAGAQATMMGLGAMAPYFKG